MGIYTVIKFIIDVILSAVLLLTLWPLLLIISAAIKLDSMGPAIYIQERLGKGGKVFKIYKFRTMVDGAIGMGSGLRTYANDPRITRVGSFLRRKSLDEIPQLLNIIKGEMSFVGPRPPVPYHPKNYEEYDDIQRKRFLVRPGITGLAQITYRNNATWDERIVKDVEYVNTISLLTDMKIVLCTFSVVATGKRVYLDENRLKQINRDSNEQG